MCLQDPNHTSAWNALLQGRKRWILYPPTQPPPGVRVSADGRDVVTPISVCEWLIHYYAHHSKLLSASPYTPLPLPSPPPPLSSLSNPSSYPPSHYSPVECLHQPGEVLFIPNGWWHLAVNLELSLAVTQNLVSRHSLLNTRAFLREEGNAALERAFDQRVREVHPGLVEQLEKARGEVDEWRSAGGTKAKVRSLWDSLIANDVC